jgi:hypothetical protein
MARAILISEQRVKQLTNLDDNVRVEEITPFILQAQDLYLQDTLGTKFYDRLQQGVIDNDLNADEKTLLNDYIGSMLAHYALYLMLPGLKYKLVEKGILSGQSEETGATTLDELKYLRQTVLDTAEFYDTRLRQYLCDVTSGTYPEYDQPGSDGMMPNNDVPYFSGLVTPKYFRKYGEQYPTDECSNCTERTN